MSNARELAQIPSTPSGRRNILINGAHNIQQRGVSSVTGLDATDDGLHTVDAWRFSASDNTGNNGLITMSVETDAPAGSGFNYSTKFLVTTADTNVESGTQLRLSQHIEAQNVRHLNYGTSSAKQVTLSFWVKSNKTGDYTAGLFLDTPASGSDINISQVYTINSANTWEYKTITFAPNTTTVINSTDNDHGLRCWFHQAAGSSYTSGTANTWGGSGNRAVGQGVNLYDTVNNYWQVTGCQLEIGPVATEFEHRSFGEELALCQRYFHKLHTARTLYGSDYGVNSFARLAAPVTMRAVPTVTATSSSTVLGTYHTKDMVQLYHSGTASNASNAVLDAEM